MSWLQQRLAALRQDLVRLRTPGSFLRNALFTSADAAVNISLQLVFTPILARIYSPEAYGVFGLYTSITNNLSNVAVLGFPLAFSLPREEGVFHALVRCTWWLLVVTTLLTLPVFLFPSLLYAVFPSWSIMGDWCMAVPWMVFVIGVAQIMIAWYNRAKAFGAFARTNMLTNLSLRITNLSFGLGVPGLPGLLVSETLVRTAVIALYVKDLGKHGVDRVLRSVPARDMRTAALAYKEYPLYIFPSRWLNLLALQLPIYGLVGLGLENASGQFTMAGALLLMPLRMFGYSLYGVFLRRAIEAGPEKPAELADITRRMYQRLLLFGMVPIMGITFFADVVLRFALGDQWGAAGVFTALLGPFYLFRLLSEPLSAVFIALRNERSLFIFNLLVFVGSALAVLIGNHWPKDPTPMVALFGGINALVYFGLSARVLHATGSPWLNLSLRTLAFSALAAIFFAGIRWWLFGSLWPGG